MKKSGAGKSLKSSVPAARWPCHPLTRVNYFTGQVLTVDDFRTEQNYRLAKHRRHNLLCHGFGVVQGLEVSVVKNGGIWEAIVHPGFAIDAAGNEIQLCAEVRAPLVQSQSPIHVVVVYRECPTEVVPVLGEPGTSESSSTMPSRVLEASEVLLRPNASPAEPVYPPPEGEGCPPPALPLARIVRRRHLWYVDRTFKPTHAH